MAAGAVYTVLGQADQAIIHAQRCLTLTEGQRHLLQDFDVAYAYEAMARAYTLSKDKAQAWSTAIRPRRRGSASAMRKTAASSRTTWKEGTGTGLIEPPDRLKDSAWERLARRLVTGLDVRPGD